MGTIDELPRRGVTQVSLESEVPKHVAIIMDGNGRWAQRRRRPRVFGHVRGASRVKPVVEAADDLGIKALTLFAFSTENWERPRAEVDVVWRIMKKFLLKEAEALNRKGVRMRMIGEVERLPKDVQRVCEQIEKDLSQNTGIQLSIAVSYGSRNELVRAAQKFAQDCVAGKVDPSELEEARFKEYLWTAALGDLSDVDLVIRTSGEVRVSNFLLFQAAYAEYCFTEVCWPDFAPTHFREAIDVYTGRDRRYGGLTRSLPESGYRLHEKRS